MSLTKFQTLTLLLTFSLLISSTIQDDPKYSSQLTEFLPSSIITSSTKTEIKEVFETIDFKTIALKDHQYSDETHPNQLTLTKFTPILTNNDLSSLESSFSDEGIFLTTKSPQFLLQRIRFYYQIGEEIKGIGKFDLVSNLFKFNKFYKLSSDGKVQYNVFSEINFSIDNVYVFDEDQKDYVTLALNDFRAKVAEAAYSSLITKYIEHYYSTKEASFRFIEFSTIVPEMKFKLDYSLSKVPTISKNNNGWVYYHKTAVEQHEKPADFIDFDDSKDYQQIFVSKVLLHDVLNKLIAERLFDFTFDSKTSFANSLSFTFDIQDFGKFYPSNIIS